MPSGPGKYGANAEQLLTQFGGTWCVILMDGRDGPVFDVATSDPMLLITLPTLLRGLADGIERDQDVGQIFGNRQ